MLLSRDAFVDIFPSAPQLTMPVHELIQRFVQLGLDPSKCRAFVEQLVKAGRLRADDFHLDAFDDGGLVLSEQALYFDVGEWTFTAGTSEGFVSSRLEPDQLEAAADIVRIAAHGDDLDELREACDFLDDDVFARMTRKDEGAPRWPLADRPGIYRREHASLLVRSRTSAVLLDPLFMHTMGMKPLRRAPSAVGSDVLDAIAITHSHGDHWHLPSILAAAPSADTTVIVPRVPRRSLLTSHVFDEELALVGQRRHVAEWHSTMTVGDIRIDVLPFYGEQPCAEPPGPPPGLRSFGNCYRFETPDFSAIALVDSGRDPDGDLVDVVRRSSELRGPPDVVLACMRNFPSPFFGGLGHYWAALPFARLRELFDQFRRGTLPFTTAGTEGLVDVCAASGARYFLPYADGFEAVGAPISDIGWGMREPAEAERIAVLERRLREAGLHAEARTWNPGDRACFGADRALEIVRC